jgi:hypothetical protein
VCVCECMYCNLLLIWSDCRLYCRRLRDLYYLRLQREVTPEPSPTNKQFQPTAGTHRPSTSNGRDQWISLKSLTLRFLTAWRKYYLTKLTHSLHYVVLDCHVFCCEQRRTHDQKSSLSLCLRITSYRVETYELPTSVKRLSTSNISFSSFSR